MKNKGCLIPALHKKWQDARKIVGKDPGEVLSDFLLIQDNYKIWHCIGIGGQGHLQDSFFHAVGNDLLQPFTYIGRVESGRSDTEWMWAPYAVLRRQGGALMYYCHRDPAGFQLRILQSVDASLNAWKPFAHPDLEDGNIAFRQEGDRDACIFFDENAGKYLMYYSAVMDARIKSEICLRTSNDLIHWSEPSRVMGVPEGFVEAESPFVYKKNETYYLFVSGYDYGRIAVYASDDPFSFGDPVADKLCELNGHAPEIVVNDGVEYIACAAIHTKTGGTPAEHDLSGVYIQELKWTGPDATACC